VTSHPQHTGSGSAHPVPQRALGPYRVAPIGYGAMRLTGPGVFGPPPDRDDAVQLLRQAVEAGVDHIDTAEYYGPTWSTSSSGRRSTRTRPSSSS
jgi:aryl-alcohol dehydrogenase-like predicted oxidoreductase